MFNIDNSIDSLFFHCIKDILFEHQSLINFNDLFQWLQI